MIQKEIYRVIDANFNRAREGARVVEEIARFVLENAALTEKLKDIRHALTHAVSGLPIRRQDLLGARDSQEDVGACLYSREESERSNLHELASVNLGRVEEAIRVLEEFSKFLDPEAGLAFKEIRFRIYSIEKEMEEAWCD